MVRAMTMQCDKESCVAVFRSPEGDYLLVLFLILVLLGLLFVLVLATFCVVETCRVGPRRHSARVGASVVGGGGGAGGGRAA
ncbi:hypothetical protein QJS04_geneDACA013808 [Acorus gramineus]|uniref:Uncharacterized protein n=1 Tax=Acorus gramineus TaxID=55184 RepID=A0AAV9AVY1_ACOGR|nr:hypothetical protein QJS04_geneDACA013808 [Acorus gramineus]